MRYRLLASYQGAPYEAGLGPTGGDLVLFAACPPPEELGFEPATGHWRKRVERDEVEALWESRPIGQFGGEPCIVLDDLGDRLHIVFVGHDSLRAGQIGYWEVDRGVFELVTPRQNVIDIVEERRPLPPALETPEPSALPPPIPPSAIPGRGTGPPAARPAASALAAATLAPAPLPTGPLSGPDLPVPASPPAAVPAARPAARPAMPAARAAARLAVAQPDEPRAGRPKQPAASRQPAAAGQAARARLQADPATGPFPVDSGIALPHVDEPPLPLEAQALLAASAARSDPASRPDHSYPGAARPETQADSRPRAPRAVHSGSATALAAPATRPLHDGLPHDHPLHDRLLHDGPLNDGAPHDGPAGTIENAFGGARRRRAKRRLPTQRIFSDLATLAAIPPTAYAVGEEVDGAMCLIRSDEGFEVFHSADGAKLEARVFNDEESAYFYLFGVLAAEAVRTGVLAPRDSP